MRSIPPGQIDATVEAFLRPNDATPSTRRRERSWDFCFNHFQANPKPTEAMDLSCLQLGYYLASWGMLRGSSFLFRETNVRHFQQVVRVIEEHNDAMRDVDVQQYRETDTTLRFNEVWNALDEALLPSGGRSLTLISKVIMGVWGSMPSYDTYFIRTFRSLAETPQEKRAFGYAAEPSRLLLADVFDAHRDEIEATRQRFTTLDITTGAPTTRPMTRAKVLDIYGFQTAFAPVIPVNVTQPDDN